LFLIKILMLANIVLTVVKQTWIKLEIILYINYKVSLSLSLIFFTFWNKDINILFIYRILYTELYTEL